MHPASTPLCWRHIQACQPIQGYHPNTKTIHEQPTSPSPSKDSLPLDSGPKSCCWWPEDFSTSTLISTPLVPPQVLKAVHSNKMSVSLRCHTRNTSKCSLFSLIYPSSFWRACVCVSRWGARRIKTKRRCDERLDRLTLAGSGAPPGRRGVEISLLAEDGRPWS